MDFIYANAIRFLAMDMVENAKSGHPGMPMGMADVTTVLYKYFLKYNPKDPKWHDRDRLILSAGHGSALLYAIFYLTGYEDITIEELKRFRQLGSKTAGHPEYGLAEGIETSTGPLGQGIANAVGMALSERILNDKFGDNIVNHKTYVIVGDGCLAEGISQEAISIAGHLKMKNLVVLFDDNGITIDGPTSLSTSDNHLVRFQASGWNTKAIDGHNYEQIQNALAWSLTSDKPVLIACKTKIAFGAPTKEGKAVAHGSPLGNDEIAKIRVKLAWQYPPFEIPEDILKGWRSFADRNQIAYQNWKKSLNVHKKKKEYLNYFNSELPKEFFEALGSLKEKLMQSEQIKEATRKSSERVIELLAKHVPNVVGGSADLTPSNNTKVPDLFPIAPGDYNGRYIYYGEREHAMAAMMNGIALHGGLIPYGGSFLVFTDYCRPSIRLSALMGLRVIYVMTHDSIGLGEDGPTHQPIEHLASFRAMPNILVFRPADIVETLECWELALRHTKTPSILALTRQNVAQIRKGSKQENLSAKGAYILREAKSELQVTIFASGSEVELACKVAGNLEDKKIGAKVISVPCLDLFKQQDMEYQVSLLCNKSFKVAIEAAVEQGWERLIGPHGMFFGMETFGESAPANDLFKHFGFDAEVITQRIIERITHQNNKKLN